MKSKIFPFFIVIIVCLLGAAIGYLIASINTPKPIIIRTSLPNSVANYALSNVSADFQGQIVRKASDFVGIKTERGTEFNAYYNSQGISTFVNAATEQPIQFASLKVGDRLKGGLSIVTSIYNTEIASGQRKLGDVILHYVRVSN